MVNKAFVFPGQGSQHIGMLNDLAEQDSVIQTTFELASDLVHYDLWQLIQEGPEDKLNQTEHTQVAMLTADVSIFRLLQSQGLSECQMMAGHSLGEYAALVSADALSFEDGVRLVARRGQLMQDTVPFGTGAMAAIVGLADEEVEGICAQSSTPQERVTAANYNAIGQVVIAGHLPAVERAIQKATDAQARLAKIIPVSVPCHCPLLNDAAEAFEADLASTPFKKPRIDVISNVDLHCYQTPEEIRERLKKQLFSPVRWVETVQKMKQSGIELLVECGPGKVLTGLAKRIDRQMQAVSIMDAQGLNQFRAITEE